MIVTDTFVPLVQAQARARGATPRLVVLPHPVGGLNNDELTARIGQAAETLTGIIPAAQMHQQQETTQDD